MAFFNVSSVEEDSSGMTLYSTEETLEEKWLQYDNMSKDEVFLDVHNRHQELPCFQKKIGLMGSASKRKAYCFFT